MTTQQSPLFINQVNLKTREDIVADAIRNAILRGTFKPGEKLDQQTLAVQLGVSRSPVREALRTLAAEELVTNIPHRGAVVSERSLEELKELLFIRTMLEGAAARLAAPQMDEERLAKLKHILEEGEQSGDHEYILSLNNDFHSMIYSAYRQPQLVALIQQLRNKVAPYNRIYLDLPGRKDAAWIDHRRIYDACVLRNGELAEQETRRHLEQVFQGMIKVASQIKLL